jgi:hypothetical protein
MHEFTAAEVFEPFRPLMPDAEARRMAALLCAPVDMEAILAEPPQVSGGSGIPYWSVPTVNFSRDTLILLSLVSAEAAAKVDRYRGQLRDAGAISAQDEEEWQRRREALAMWRDAK